MAKFLDELIDARVTKRIHPDGQVDDITDNWREGEFIKCDPSFWRGTTTFFLKPVQKDQDETPDARDIPGGCSKQTKS